MKGNGVDSFTTENITHPEYLFADSSKFAYWNWNEGFFWSDWEKKTLPPGGDKVALLSDYQRRTVRDGKIVARASQLHDVIFCDFIADDPRSLYRGHRRISSKT